MKYVRYFIWSLLVSFLVWSMTDCCDQAYFWYHEDPWGPSAMRCEIHGNNAWWLPQALGGPKSLPQCWAGCHTSHYVDGELVDSYWHFGPLGQ